MTKNSAIKDLTAKGCSAEEEQTHFGFETVARGDKARRVANVFHSVASRYDIMNDVMSIGLHRVWKRVAIELCAIRPGNTVLDLAGGTGDLSFQFSKRVGSLGKVVLSDINSSMLNEGRQNLLDKGVNHTVAFAQLDAQSLPFSDATFDCVAIAFGLRNVTDKDLALHSIFKVLKPGGRLMVLEFSKVSQPLLAKLYHHYSFHVLPLMGKLIAGDSGSYRYLAESIRLHPDQGSLLTMIEAAGFFDVQYYNMTGGVVAIHKAIKPLSNTEE